ncbi:adenylyltransferase and sulfurtransferase MOCS3-like [Panonychus citri]|uniref:adenylyltransferase and sulfurtransferase MOCS3-like n=1 Tax=Panonychus citri TaxID=50023 RepID=UPI00230823F1|nr:adenylyltransferase and sulfurtransferase MOCS3-like [Panonychus citri]XP_053215031.1 adenylyltransferase and sulfurtransferase MOCS3-like [Panonychus citri]
MSGLKKEEVARYSRQLLLPEIGVDGQLKLKSSSVLIVGCGGLGCPCAIYLAAAGVGKIGLVDHDKVELSNLHRQILHTESRVGTSKAASVKESLNQLNSNLSITIYDTKFDQTNAIDIVKEYDVIVDATDNAPTRYLINDAAVINNKPLVSGAALRFEGQLTVYHYDSKTPCYRCLFPKPPPPGTVTNCSDGGVLGVIPGIIGSLQSLEVIKMITGLGTSYAGKMLLYDGLTGSIRNVKLREKCSNCAVCGDSPTIDGQLIDYEQFCGTPMCDDGKILKILTPEERITCQEYKETIVDTNTPHLLIDVRSSLQASIVKLPNAINLPLDVINRPNGLDSIKELIDSKKVDKVFFMCRRGNASQKACRLVKDNLVNCHLIQFKDIIGGITAWAKEIDQQIPIY